MKRLLAAFSVLAALLGAAVAQNVTVFPAPAGSFVLSSGNNSVMSYIQGLPVAITPLGSGDQLLVIQGNSAKVAPASAFGSAILSSGSACTGLSSNYQFFANTTSAPTGTILNVFDLTQCVPWATINQTAHTLTLTAGALALTNTPSTTGSVTLKPPAGSLGTAVLTVPAVTDTLAALGTVQTWTAIQTLNTPTLNSATLNTSTLNGTVSGPDGGSWGVGGLTVTNGAFTTLATSPVANFNTATITALLTGTIVSFNTGTLGNASFTSATVSGTSTLSAVKLTATPTFAASTSGATTQTFTNSPCTSSITSERWIGVQISGQTGNWFIPACQ